MCEEDFVKLIVSIGFNYRSIYNKNEYKYNKFRIDVWDDGYDFYNGSEWFMYVSYNELDIIYNSFKKEFRSIKLKQLLK